MKTEHVSDLELQQYALDPTGCSKEAQDHMGSCALCQGEAATYRHLFNGLRDQPAATFDFDLAEMVLSRLPAPGPLPTEAERPGISTWVMIALVCFMTGIPLYLFRKNIWNTFLGISGLFLYIILGVAAIMVVSRIMAMYKKYQRQLDRLNFT
ncbi:MAG: hypothetical protein Q8927_11300 [Bacteroidota bacterium]|nr:hypothetical protein [Bacteroidota bacterium]MDP4252642.1 hypothetical protein [Bacteroidota bacterium]